MTPDERRKQLVPVGHLAFKRLRVTMPKCRQRRRVSARGRFSGRRLPDPHHDAHRRDVSFDRGRRQGGRHDVSHSAASAFQPVHRSTALCRRAILFIEVDQDCAATQAVRRDLGRASPAKWIEHHPTGGASSADI